MEALNKFREHLMQTEKSELTIEKYVQDARRFLEWLGMMH